MLGEFMSPDLEARASGVGCFVRLGAVWVGRSMGPRPCSVVVVCSVSPDLEAGAPDSRSGLGCLVRLFCRRFSALVAGGRVSFRVSLCLWCPKKGAPVRLPKPLPDQLPVRVHMCPCDL